MSLDPAAELAIALDSGNWAHYFDAQSRKRGQALARQGRVTLGGLEHTDQTYFLNGSVDGNTGNYSVQAFIQQQDRRLALFTSCDCPVHMNCKHGVALIQTFMNEVMPHTPTDPISESAAESDITQAHERQWQRWLNRFNKTHEDDAQNVESDRRLALFLSLDKGYRAISVQIAAVWLRPSRALKGAAAKRWVDPIGIQRQPTGLKPAPASGWPEGVEENLQLLLQGAPQRHRDIRTIEEYPLATDLQQRALLRLLESTEPPPIFHNKQTGAALHYTPDRTLTLDWQLGEDGLQHPVALLDDVPVDNHRVALVAIGNALWQFDLNQACFGPVEGDTTLFTQLEMAPGLPPEKAAWLAQQLEQMPQRPKQLKAPAAPVKRQINDVKPTLSMHMQLLALAQPNRAAPTDTLGLGILRIDYDGISVPLDDTSQVHFQQGNELVDITRQPETEKALVRQLPSGMAPLVTLLAQSNQPSEDFDPASMVLLRDQQLPTHIEEWPDCLATPDEWWPMIHQLRQQGVAITFDDDFPDEPTYLTPDAWYGELEEGGGGWFTLSLDIDLEGERVSLLPLLGQLLDHPDFPIEPEPGEVEDATWNVALGDNHFAVLPLGRLRELMSPIIDWLRDNPGRETLALPVTQASQLDALAKQEQWQGRENVQQLAAALHQLPPALPTPEAFAGTLRPYQAEGIAWLRFLATLNIGGILADDMGLGKTIQVLAHILDERQRGNLNGPVLIVATTSLVGNWQAETARFVPTLSALAVVGSKAARARLLERMGSADIVITTYPLLIRDIEALSAQRFSLAVFDEAQAIKNPAAQTAKAVRGLNAERRLALTGTPLENHLGELWAELDAINPGFLGSQQWFGQHYRRPIEQHADSDARARLLRRIRPLLLRRTKQEVLTDLPEKTDIQRSVELVGKQRELYESLRIAQHERLRQSIEKRGLAQSGIVMLDALLKLRQVCCDPRLVKLDSAQRVTRSVKLELLRELLPELIDEGRHILVFSQFTEMLDLISDALQQDKIAHLMLTGQTPNAKRSDYVTQFQRGDVPVFLISLKAGGVGLNLTQADTVIHYDPWWNPAVEAQATGRAHRIGQQNPVFVYKLVASGTVEERIMALQTHKADLASSILAPETHPQDDKGKLAFDENDLAELFAPLDA
ncbi:hypothetical protein HVA01_17140 [Halovibrio variabilis]|uniref:Helicase n=1 Tax=Halovibrio variabilis TaxID=31910 RepID=A0A511UQW5_9GAMM|nr:DEAD/DEAH box helicase [Halovibrio variabilis]GEN28068.1 hypothetical protein HVA01_17140 [Halovibrio variabilis]